MSLADPRGTASWAGFSGWVGMRGRSWSSRSCTAFGLLSESVEFLAPQINCPTLLPRSLEQSSLSLCSFDVRIWSRQSTLLEVPTRHSRVCQDSLWELTLRRHSCSGIADCSTRSRAQIAILEGRSYIRSRSIPFLRCQAPLTAGQCCLIRASFIQSCEQLLS